MKAAVVTSFGEPPSYQEFEAPQPQRPHEVLVDVLAAGLHPRVRSQADGSHYTSTTELPLVPGIDGVGRAADGTIHYFVLPDTRLGSMAEQTVIDDRRSIILPEGCNPVMVAAAMNPAMSSWVALRQRIAFQPGQRVMVLGATGNAGRMAVQIAKHLGASHVTGVGRGTERIALLPGLGADAIVSLNGTPADVVQGLADTCCDVDVVIDYLWGQPATDAMLAIATNRTNPNRPLSWIQIGAVAGLDAAIPSAALRATRLQIIGSGQGSVSTRGILSELPDLAALITVGAFQSNARTAPLREIQSVWSENSRNQDRLVITP